MLHGLSVNERDFAGKDRKGQVKASKIGCITYLELDSNISKFQDSVLAQRKVEVFDIQGIRVENIESREGVSEKPLGRQRRLEGLEQGRHFLKAQPPPSRG